MKCPDDCIYKIKEERKLHTDYSFGYTTTKIDCAKTLTKKDRCIRNFTVDIKDYYKKGEVE